MSGTSETRVKLTSSTSFAVISPKIEMNLKVDATFKIVNHIIGCNDYGVKGQQSACALWFINWLGKFLTHYLSLA